jgi:ATP-dependent exoDNAse (exonuclease V) alpha subunit
MTKQGISGTRSINRTLHAMTSASKPEIERWDFAAGDPIICLVNDYGKELWNGSLGGIERVLKSTEDFDGQRFARSQNSTAGLPVRQCRK